MSNSNKISSSIPQIIEINDIIGEKCDLDLEIMQIPFNNFDKAKTSSKIMGNIKAYGANTYQGLVRNYNEDRVSIIINMTRPENYTKKYWPKISFFGIYDGHGGAKCADFLRDCLHKIIFSNEFFPENVEKAIKNGFLKAENDFLSTIAIDKNTGNILDRSGSCAILVIIVDNKIYVANVGDSRCIMSVNGGKDYKIITSDHKPSNENEKKRIIQSGGEVYQTQTPISTLNNVSENLNPNNNEQNTNSQSTNNHNNNQINQILIGPYRVLPGRLSVSRTIGDIEAKSVQFGGNPQVIIPLPDVFSFDLEKIDIDFIVLGCDGIYDQLSNEEILDSGWEIFPKDDIGKDINEKCGILVDFILKASMARKSFDNVTCVVISLKDEKEMKNDMNIKIKNFKKEIIQNEDLNLEKINTINTNNIEIIKPTMPVIQKKSFNYLSHVSHIYPKNNAINNKSLGITLNIDNSQHIRNIHKLKLDKKKKGKKIVPSKKRMTSSGISSNLGFKNIRKILNKSEINPQYEKDKKNKLDTERLHLKRTFINQVPKYNLTNSLNNLNFEYSNSPIEKIRNSINTLKIEKISNRIHSSNHLIRKRAAQFTQNNMLKKNLNKNKKRFITMNNLCGISNITNITNITNMNNININNSHEQKRVKILNKSDLSKDLINKKPLKYKTKTNKFSDLKLNKNRNDLKIKLQNNSGIHSFRNYLDIRANSTNKNIITNTSKRKTSHKKILNNLFINFKGDNQKTGKLYSKIDATNIKRKLTEKKIKNEEKGQKFLKNYEMYKNKKLNLNINYINSSNNYHTKSSKGGIKYLNSAGNNGVIESINSNSNINSIESIKMPKKYNKLINKKIKIKK